MMVRWLLASLTIVVLGFGVDVNDSRADGPTDPLRVVVHVNFADPDRQGHGLKNVANVLREVGDDGATIEVVCHGEGIGLVVKARAGHAERVAELVKRGVRFVACENTMRQRSIQKEDLLPGVGTVPSGAVEVVRKQHEGHAYFKP